MVGGIWVFAEPPGWALSQHQLVGLLFPASSSPAASLNVEISSERGLSWGVASTSLLIEP